MIAALVLCAGLTSQAAAVPPPPPNPSDGDIAGANAHVDAQVGRVGELINSVAAANQQLRLLDDQVAQKRELVNKALVDLQDARDAVGAAVEAVSRSKGALDVANVQIEEAQKKFDGYAAKTYASGNSAGSVASYLGAGSAQDVLDRAQLLKMMSDTQQRIVDGLQRARAEEANKNAAARKSKQDAEAAAVAAEARKAEAENAIAAARAALEQQVARKSQIESQRAAAQRELDAARSSAAGLAGQRQAYVAWEAQRAAEQAAIEAAAEAAKRFAIEAAARVAANQAARDRARELATGTRPHTQLDPDDEDAPVATPKSKPKKPKKTKPSVTGSEAIEAVIDRGMAQIGVPYAWGGGDENGPTLGIRDGGVADQHGDYKKVGFDCSGLMLYAFAGIGISLPHYSGYQYTAGEQIPKSQMQRGDMLFWGPNGSQHVALYLGDGQMLEAPQSGEYVRVSPVREGGLMPYVVRLVS